MTEKFTYYINFAESSDLIGVYRKVDLHNNELKLIYKIEENHEGFALKVLDGSFILKGWEFDQIVRLNNYGPIYDIPIKIYENGDENTGTLIYWGYFNQFNEFNYNEKTVKISKFISDEQINKLMAVYDKEYTIDLEGFGLGFINYLPIYLNLSYSGKKITDASLKIRDVIQNLSWKYFDNDLLLSPAIDENDFWSNPINAKFEQKKIRLANLKNIINYGTGSPKKISLKRLFEVLETMFKIYWYLDEGLIKFKTVKDFCQNTLDLSNDLIHKKLKKINWGLSYVSEGITFNDNNNLPENDNFKFAKCKVDYQQLNDKSKEYSLTEICTRYTEGNENYNIDGFFFAYVDHLTNKIEYELAANTHELADNAKLCPANLMNDNYKDYLFTRNSNFKVNGNFTGSAPTHLRPFIEMPEITKVLPSIASFFDSIIYEITATNRMIARVWEQSTDLNSNITTFKSYEFKTESNTTPPPPPPPPPPIVNVISVNTNYHSVDNNGGTLEVVITSNTAWTIAPSDTWISSDQYSGSGNDTILLTFAAGTINRVGSVSFEIADGENAYININQYVVIHPVENYLLAAPKLLTFDSSGSTNQIIITSDSAWTITKHSWITLDKVSGSGDDIINITIPSTSAQRTGYVYITGAGITKTIIVNQTAPAMILQVDYTFLNFPSLGGPKSLNITSNDDWIITSNQSWITFSQSSGNGNATISVIAEPSLLQRTAILTLTNGVTTIYINVNQTQEDYITVNPIFLNYHGPYGQFVYISANVPWTVICNEAWITSDIYSGVGDGAIYLNVAYSPNARVGSVTITDGTIIKNVSIFYAL